ncbi:DUF4241 domain-containing protein [Micromonospora sp. WMMD754]|uniref:DUF4241 domain-containing protein n=1 Tax=Micromonospora sp. WMMD754 TaxID=3404114 RepID=UPI003BF57F2A
MALSTLATTSRASQSSYLWSLADAAGARRVGSGQVRYPVDAGVSAPADAVVVRALARREFDQVDDVFIPAQVPPAPAAIDAITDEATGANVIIVSSGWGDGLHPTFVG